MSLDKAIRYCKEHRKDYTGSKAFDATCRNHGSCPWCEDNRKHHDRKNRIAADEELKIWESEANALFAQTNNAKQS